MQDAFSVAATYLDLRAAGYIGPKFAGYDSASCFHLLCGGKAAYFSLEYDQAAISTLNPVVERLASSLKPGSECSLRAP